MKTSAMGNSTAAQADYEQFQLETMKHVLAGIRPDDGPPHASHAADASKGAQEAAPVSVPTSMALTPEGLMAYCQSRLNSLDTQMSNIFNQQQANAAVTQDVDAIAAKLNDLGEVANTSTTDDNPKLDATQSFQDIKNDYAQAISDAKTAGNPNLAAQLTQDEDTFLHDCTGSSPVTITTNEVTNLQQNLKSYGNALNSDSEMNMINLQSLMSQRQTAVQLTTNLVQSLGEQSQDIAKNIGQ